MRMVWGWGVGSVVWLQTGEFQVLVETLLEMDSLLDSPFGEEFWSSRDSLVLAGDGQCGLCWSIMEGQGQKTPTGA